MFVVCVATTTLVITVSIKAGCESHCLSTPRLDILPVSDAGGDSEDVALGARSPHKVPHTAAHLRHTQRLHRLVSLVLTTPT